MANKYKIEVCKQLQERFRETDVCRPMRVSRHEVGDELVYNVQSIVGQSTASVRLRIEQFVGGGFAGQVYRVKVLKIGGGSIPDVNVGGIYALKILIPPSRFSCLFRNMLYWIGFQGPFQQQVNPAAARAGALWQKLIRRGAAIRLGDEQAVVDVYGTFVDSEIGSCGELREWVDGRTWKLEVDDRLDLLKRWRRGKTVDEEKLGSPEYRAKRVFMRDFVELLHEMGAYEFARQYEWSTCKSQPNCLKRNDEDGDPAAGLVAVDFRAGLTLLPFLPMSPGDVKLIVQGIQRGSIVQFDRGNLDQLEWFVDMNDGPSAEMGPLLEELRTAERIYRDSIPDVTHNHVRLLYSGRLWSTIFGSAVTGWRVRNLIDRPCEERLRRNPVLTFLFFLVGCIPFLGRVIRRAWGGPDWREHYARMLTSGHYLRQAFAARVAEKAIDWYRSGRLGEEGAQLLAEQPWRILGHAPLSILPGGLHRFIVDPRYAKEKLAYLFVRPIRLYLNAQVREKWLRDMVAEGQSKNMLSDDDAATIVSQLKEPFIQKYLKSLAVHVCMAPTTHIVALVVAGIYVLRHPEMPRKQSLAIGAGIVALFQVVPISPGSLCRGIYVLYLVIRERNFKDYNIAVFLAFFKYVGYLAFPIQMTYRFPTLARFMAAHWATEAAHVVPVFGERGALLEHWVFCLFYNWPLTVRGRMQRRAQVRAAERPRYWHVPVCALVGACMVGLVDYGFIVRTGHLPSLKAIWWLMVALPLWCGAIVTWGCGGASLTRRIVAAAISGASTGILASILSVPISHSGASADSHLLALAVWRVFIFTILAIVGAIGIELALPEPPQQAMNGRD
jgi:hypothetical protein